MTKSLAVAEWSGQSQWLYYLYALLDTLSHLCEGFVWNDQGINTLISIRIQPLKLLSIPPYLLITAFKIMYLHSYFCRIFLECWAKEDNGPMHLMYPWFIQGINQQTLDALVHYLFLLNTPVRLFCLTLIRVFGSLLMVQGICMIDFNWSFKTNIPIKMVI